mmetsp:Transcript_6476/g.10423  ORF Transcript_6476/g.10423 Transcript_6476/m.10423 type:complete len:138 (+) Transcript_6476:432-845(+)
MVHPRLWGIGLAMTTVVGMTLMYYVILFPWSLSFFFDSFSGTLPWTSDEGLWNANYFHDGMLQKSDGDESLRLVPKLVICLILTYILVYFTVWKGLMTSSQVVYITVPVPCFLLAILLIKGITLPGSEIGLYYLFVP